MPLKNHIIILLLLFIFPLHYSKGQSNFTEGVIVTNNGDTIRGLINYLDWARNPRSISFKTTKASKDENLSTRDISYFEVVGTEERFLRVFVSISMDSYTLDNGFKSRDLKPAFVRDTVFLRILSWGKCVALFSYSDQLKTRFYISSPTQLNTVDELVYRLYKSTDASTDQDRIGYFEGFKNQLAAAASKCPDVLTSKLRGKIRISQYNASLVKIADAINGGTYLKTPKQGSSFHFARNKFYVGIGMSYTTMNYTGDPNSKSDASNFPYFSFGVDNAKVQNVSHLHFQGEFILGRSENHLSTTTTSGTDHFLLNTASLSFLLKYHFNTTGFAKFFAAGGARMNFSHVKEVDLNQTNNVFWMALPVKVGVQMRQVEIMYCPTIPLGGLAEIDHAFFNINTKLFGVAYYF